MRELNERSLSPGGKESSLLTDAQAAEALEMATGAPPSAAAVCCGCNTPWHEHSPFPLPSPHIASCAQQTHSVSHSPQPTGLSLFAPNTARTYKARPPNTLAPEHQVARLQRELYRERRIMENEDASSGPTNATRRKRRSTNIGHRFGSGRGPLVLKATLHHGDVNTAVGF